MDDVTRDPGFWNWLKERESRDESYQPLYVHIEAPRPCRRSEESSDTGTDFGVNHTVYQV